MAAGWRKTHYGMGDNKVTCLACGSAHHLYAGPGARQEQHAWMARHLFLCPTGAP